MGGLGPKLIRFNVVAALLLWATWPFHAKKYPAPPQAPSLQEDEDERSAAGRCDKEGDLWFYLGSDKFIGFSHASCGKAYRAWINTHIDPVKMSKA